MKNFRVHPTHWLLSTGAICISISAVLSLAIAVIHFRMPCWEAETKDPEWFY